MKKKTINLLIIGAFLLFVFSIVDTGKSEQFAFGVNSHTSYYKEMNELGLNFQRFDYTWSSIEKQKGVFDFVVFDSSIKRLDSNNLSVLIILSYGNSLYCPPSNKRTDYVGCNVPINNDQDFNTFKEAFGNYTYMTVKYLSEKYNIKYYEVYNEPYGFGFDYGRDGDIVAIRYTQLLQEAYIRAKQANPDAIILNGGMGTDSNLIKFINTMYLYGAKDYFDIMNLHYPRFSSGNYNRILNVMEIYKDGKKKIWITEDGRPSFGCSRYGGSNGTIRYCETNLSMQNQADYIRNQLAHVKNNTDRITGYFVYQMADGGCSGYNWDECNYGLLGINNTKKPAFEMYKNIIANHKANV